MQEQHSNHYLNEAAAQANLRRLGFSLSMLCDETLRPCINIGRPPEKRNRVIVLDELGVYWYQKIVYEVV